jgi:hypothetical protein
MRIDTDTHSRRRVKPSHLLPKELGPMRSMHQPFLHLELANASGTGTAGNDIGVQRDRAIPRQRPAFQIHAGGYGD